MISFMSGEECCCGGAKQIMAVKSKVGPANTVIYLPSKTFASKWLDIDQRWDGPISFVPGQIIKWVTFGGLGPGFNGQIIKIYECIAPINNSGNPFGLPGHWRERTNLTSGFFDLHKKYKGMFVDGPFAVGDITQYANLFWRCWAPTVGGTGTPDVDRAHWEYIHMFRELFSDGANPKRFLRWRETTTFNFQNDGGEITMNKHQVRPSSGTVVREYLIDTLTFKAAVVVNDSIPQFERRFPNTPTALWKPVPSAVHWFYPNIHVGENEVSSFLSDAVFTETTQTYKWFIEFRAFNGTFFEREFGVVTQTVEALDEYTDDQLEQEALDMLDAVDFDDIPCGFRAVPFFNPLGALQVNIFANAEPKATRSMPNGLTVVRTRAWVNVQGPYCEVFTPEVGEQTCISKESCGPVVVDPPATNGTIEIQKNCTCAP